MLKKCFEKHFDIVTWIFFLFYFMIIVRNIRRISIYKIKKKKKKLKIKLMIEKSKFIELWISFCQKLCIFRKKLNRTIFQSNQEIETIIILWTFWIWKNQNRIWNDRKKRRKMNMCKIIFEKWHWYESNANFR